MGARRAGGAAAGGHPPTLVAAFLHFDVSFMLWVLLGALGVSISDTLGLTPAEKGLLVAVPILSGSLMRVPLGVLSDRFGGRRTGMGMLIALFVPLLVGWRAGTSLPILIGVGLLLGVAGASFAVALPLASRWYPAERQGLVMGIAAAGNSGTVVANLVAPRIAASAGWHAVLALAMLPLGIVLVAFASLAKDSPYAAAPASASSYVAVLRTRELRWLCLFYAITFGGYVGLGSFMPLLLRDQYGLPGVTAGYVAALAAFAGSAARPLGGWIADRVGGVRLLSVLLGCIGALYFAAAAAPPFRWMSIVLVATMICLGLGNGAVFQIVPQCFRRRIGVATGVVGATGGLGGFAIPMLLGHVEQATGSFSVAFILFGTTVLLALTALRALAFAANQTAADSS
ncbi:MAG TPA: MFS transporter [Gemmatimonadaceae bacterium]|jgi:NNP family nitrate/nitrite transporter-like MFS transporter|nr:MFS transporter [Gemmatimonadaceae bacterium]